MSFLGGQSNPFYVVKQIPRFTAANSDKVDIFQQILVFIWAFGVCREAMPPRDMGVPEQKDAR